MRWALVSSLCTMNDGSQGRYAIAIAACAHSSRRRCSRWVQNDQAAIATTTKTPM